LRGGFPANCVKIWIESSGEQVKTSRKEVKKKKYGDDEGDGRGEVGAGGPKIRPLKGKRGSGGKERLHRKARRLLLRKITGVEGSHRQRIGLGEGVPVKRVRRKNWPLKP